tara:strand:+ start:5106 stop:7079 length:1974 start_codon:yes stop_codon:yes gene_type:complete
MSYQLNKTDGTLLTDLIDGQIDVNSTNLTLVGRNYTGYGEAFNENFIKLLESFANTAAPSNPLTGQVWWDTSEQRLKVYDGLVWKASGGPYVQNTRPQMVAGDLWIDNLNNQVYAYDGSDLMLIGPQYTQTQGTSGFQITSILDSTSRSRTVASLYIGGTLVGVFSAIEFTPSYAQRILTLVTESNPTGKIFTGFNIVDKANFKYRGIADSANALVTASGIVRTADSFLPSDANGITVGTLTVQNSGGLTIGLSQNNVQKVISNKFYIENQLRDHDLSLRVRSGQFESQIVDAVYVDAGTARVGIFTTNRLPEYTLDVEGDLRVTGNFIVEGDSVNIEVSTLKVEDKHIELAALNDSSIGNDSIVTGAGIIVNSEDGNKTLTWELAETAWTSNQNINLSSQSLTYKINGSVKLSSTGSTTGILSNISSAPQLISVGTLTNLNVANLSFTNNTISSNGTLSVIATGIGGIQITAGGPISIQDNQAIVGLSTPISARVANTPGNELLTESPDSTAATKGYVDSEVLATPITFSMDITGLGVGSIMYDAVAQYLDDMYPATLDNIGKVARIHTTSYAGAAVSGIQVTVRQDTDPDNGEVLTVSKVFVDKITAESQAVVRDISTSNTASGTAVLTPTRQLLVFASNGTLWEYDSGESVVYP